MAAAGGGPIPAASRLKSRLALLVTALVLLGLAIAPRADASVYWGDPLSSSVPAGSTIGRANDDGTAVNQAFIGGASGPTAVAVDAAHIYWVNSADRSIGRANLDGTGVNQNFITGISAALPPGSLHNNTPPALAVDGAHIYWADIDSSAIGRANLDGTGVDHNFITGLGTPQGVAVDSQHVYWTDRDLQAMGRANLDGSGVNQSFITGLGFTGGVALDAAHIYWIGSGGLGRANLDGTGVNQSFITGLGFTGGVAVDAAHIYWTNEFVSVDGASGGAIGRANLDGTGVTQTLVTDLVDPVGVAVDAPSQAAIGDVRTAEGNAGQTAFRFTVTLDHAQSAPVTVDFATADGTATAPGDYAPTAGTVTFAPGETAKAVTVQVNGDTTVEPDESFTVNLANATGNATIADGLGVGTIVNDDQAATGQPPSVSLNNFGAKTLVTLSLAARRIPAPGPLKVRVNNANGFQVTGKLSGVTVDPVSGSPRRRVKLGAKSFRIGGHAQKTVTLSLPKVLRRALRPQHKLRLRLTAQLKDPAGHTRVVSKSVALRVR